MHQPASLDDALPPSSALCAALEPGVLLSSSSSPPTPSLALARALKSDRIIGDFPPLDARCCEPVEEFPLAATLLGGSVGGVVRRPLPRGDAGGGVARRAPVAVGSVDAATAAARDEMGRVAKADARCRAPPSPALLRFCLSASRLLGSCDATPLSHSPWTASPATPGARRATHPLAEVALCYSQVCARGPARSRRSLARCGAALAVRPTGVFLVFGFLSLGVFCTHLPRACRAAASLACARAHCSSPARLMCNESCLDLCTQTPRTL